MARKQSPKAALGAKRGGHTPTLGSKARSERLKAALRPAQQRTKVANRTISATAPDANAVLVGGGNSMAALAAGDVSTAIEAQPGLSVSGSVSLARRIAAISRFRDYLDPLVGFNVVRARQLSEDYTRGWFADLQWTYYFLEATDPDLFALVDRRTSRLLEMDCVARVEKEADKTLAAEQAAMIDERIGKIDNLYEAIEHLAMAKFRGYAHCEKWHDAAGDLVHLEIIDQWNAVRDGLKGGWKYNPRAWQTGYFGLGNDLIIDPANFVIRDLGNRHINRIALLKFTSKKLTEVDWDGFVEIYGIPSGVVVGPPNVPKDKVGEFATAAEEIAKGGSGYLPYGSLYTKNDFPTGGAPFKERLEYLTEKLLLVGTGGLLTMVAKSGSGTLAGNAHSEVFEQLAKADAKQISDDINKGIVFDWIKEDFPGQKRAARFAIAANEETKTGDVVAHIKDLYAAGLEVDEQDASERTGYKLKRVAKPLPGAGDPTNDPAAKQKIENRRKIINSAGFAAATTAVFDRNSKRTLSSAHLDAIEPLLDRIAELKTTPEGDLAAALAKLKSDLPRLFAEARLQAPDIAEVWEQVLSVALLDGLTDIPTQK